MTAPPPKRRYAEREDKDVRSSIDALDARVRILAPAIMGAGVGLVWFIWTGFNPVIIPIMAVVCVVGVHLLTGVAAWLLGEAAFGTSGNTTPYKGGYSQAESHAAHGRYEEAVAAYETIVADEPANPEPYLRIARIYHKELDRLEDAAYWYRKTRREADVTPGRDLGASRELVELYLASDDRPRAIPELARIIDKFPDTPERAWAEGLLAELKAREA